MQPRRLLIAFVPLAVLTTCLAGLIYLVAQQDLRTGANDPQQQLAEDAAAQLNAGVAPSAIVTGTKLDLTASLAPFLVIYDPTGSVLATDASSTAVRQRSRSAFSRPLGRTASTP